MSILVYLSANGSGWHYAPKFAMQDERIARAFRYPDEDGFATADDAVAAVKRDRSCNGFPVEVEACAVCGSTQTTRCTKFECPITVSGEQSPTGASAVPGLTSEEQS